MGREAGGSIAPMSNSPADSDPRAAADAAQVSTSDSPADVGPQQDPVTTPDDAEPAADTGPAADEDAVDAEPAADESATDAAAPASAPVPQDPAAPAAPVPTAPGSPPPSTGDRPAPATPIPAATASMGPVPAPPAAPVPPPPAVTASPRPLQAAAPAGDAPQWSRGQWWTVLVLGVLAAITGAAALVLWYLDLTDQSYAHVEKWRLFVDMALLFLFSPFALTVVGIVQTCRKAAPSAFVATTALAPVFISTLFYHFWHSNIIASILHIAAMALALAAACMCLWGRLPHRTHTPRSAVAASALAMAATWSMGTKLLIMWVGDYGYTYYHYNYIHIYTVWSWIAVAIRAATLVCGIALLALMIFHRKVIIMRILAVALGVFTVAGTGLGVMFGLDVPAFSIPSAVLLIALVVPVFCASFRQWCAGTWTAPAWKPSAVAGRPTILARTTQVTDPDGNPLNDADIAAMLPTTRPTFWVSLFFGLFGLLPMLTANSTARSLGVVTNAYNSAMIKGFVLGILMWTAITAASYTIILFGLL